MNFVKINGRNVGLEVFAKNTWLALVVGTAALAMPASAALNQPVYSNNGNDYADPTIVYNRANGYYYIAATQGPDGTHIRVYKANTLGGLAAQTSSVYDYSNASETLLWAPELFQSGSYWYLYYCSTTNGQDYGHRIRVLRGTSIENLSYYGVLDTPSLPSGGTSQYKDWAIDAHVFQYNGNNYLAFSGERTATSHAQAVYIQQLESDLVTTTGAAYKIADDDNSSCRDHNWIVTEAPETIKNSNGTLYLTYSVCGFLDNYHLETQYLSSGSDPRTGPWTAATNSEMLATNYLKGPGHNFYFKASDGSDWTAYHTYSTSSGARVVRAKPITWNSDGSPYLGNPDAFPYGEPGTAISVAVSKQDATSWVLFRKFDGGAQLKHITADFTNILTNTYLGQYAGWIPVAVSVGTSAPHVVWFEAATGAISLWRMKSDGTKDISQDATQNTSWFPIGMAEGADNLPRVLYKGKYQSMVTVHTNDGSYSSQGASSTLTDWVPQAIAVGNDNVGRLAFRYEADERWALWECNANCSGPASQSYDWGPWDDGAGHKWNLLSIAMTNSGSYPFKTLWTLNGTDKMSNIHFSSDGSTLGAYNSTYGPYTDWVPVGIGGGSDDYARILWDDVSANSCTLWRMDTYANKYGSNFDYQRW